MPSPFRLFSAGSAIGPGIGAPRRGVRDQIADILKLVGHPPEAGGGGGFGGLDDAMGLVKSIRNFQSDLKLKPNGVVNPGGPTENLMNAFAVAQQKGGPRLVEALKPAMRDLSGQGLTFTPDPRNPDSLGIWRDNKDHRVEPDRVGNLLRKVGPGAPDLTGKQQLFAERVVGKTGRDKIMKTGGNEVPAAAESAGPGSGGTSVDPFEGIDNPNKEDDFTSGAIRRTADRFVEDTDASRREREEERKQERASKRPHRDVEKIEWEAAARKSKLTGEYAARVKDAVRVDLKSDALIGFDGLRYTVDWKPLDAKGRVLPEFQRPRPKKPEHGGHVAGSFFGGRSSRIFVSPYPHPHGFRVEIKVPPQQKPNENTPGAHLNVYVPKGEFVSEEKIR